MPSDWSGFKATRVFRGVTYRIVVEREGEGSEVSLMVDGEPVKGDVVPLPAEGKSKVSVQVRLL